MEKQWWQVPEYNAETPPYVKAEHLAVIYVYHYVQELANSTGCDMPTMARSLNKAVEELCTEYAEGR